MFNILVVEDDKNLRKLITTYLQRNKYNTYEATNGEEALNVLDQSYICLLYTSPSPRDKRQSRMPSSA